MEWNWNFCVTLVVPRGNRRTVNASLLVEKTAIGTELTVVERGKEDSEEEDVYYSVDCEDLYVALVGDLLSVEIPVIERDLSVSRARHEPDNPTSNGSANDYEVNFFNFYEEEDITIRIDGQSLRGLRDKVLRQLDRPTAVAARAIDPTNFYGNVGTRTRLVTKLLKYFHRQDEAFLYFDALKIEDRSNIKIYSFEKHVSGQRSFCVAHNAEFLKVYTGAEISKRHVYESIRDGFPCRLYFDLEYAIGTNRSTDGDAMTDQWIKLVAWKVHQLWGLTLNSQNFVVFDSSTAEKFSKHVIVLIPNDPVMVSGLHLPRMPEECLFLNNGQVKHFVDALVKDIAYEGREELEDDLNSCHTYAYCLDQHGQDESVRSRRPIRVIMKPRPGYEHFWVNKKDAPGKSFFVDTGVYSRNRVFRLYGSCKRSGDTKKSKPTLRLTQVDLDKYGPFNINNDVKMPTSREIGMSTYVPDKCYISTRRLSTDRSESGNMIRIDSKKERELLYARNLSLGAVVPEDLFVDAPRPPHRIVMQNKASCVDENAVNVEADSHLGIFSRACPYSNSSPTKRIRKDPGFTTASSLTQCGQYAQANFSEFAKSASPSYNVSGERNITSMTSVACDPLSFNPKYLCLLIPHGAEGSALMGEIPQNWVCGQDLPNNSTCCSIPTPCNTNNGVPNIQRGIGGKNGDNMMSNLGEVVKNQVGTPLLQQPFLNLHYAGQQLLTMDPHSKCGTVRAGNSVVSGSRGLQGANKHPIRGLVSPNRGVSIGRTTGKLVSLGSTDDYQLHHQENDLLSGNRGKPSPFPKVDAFVNDYINNQIRGGEVVQPPGFISKWTMSGRVGYGEASQVFIKIRYHIGGGYRYCANVKRHHKSNGVMIDVALNERMATRSLTQVCWDPECRGFRSQAEAVPYTVLPQSHELEDMEAEVFDRHACKYMQDLPGAFGQTVDSSS